MFHAIYLRMVAAAAILASSVGVATNVDSAESEMSTDGSANAGLCKSTITTNQGTMETVFTATIHTTSQGFFYVEGFEAITSGTGAYANAEGTGSFVATQDNTAGGSPRVVGTFEARPLAIQAK